MNTPLQITFRHLPQSDAIESYVRSKAEKLERFHGRVTGCHVIIDTPHLHKRHGHHYRITVDVVVPGDEIVVTRDPDQDKNLEDVFASIDAAFDDAQRRIEDSVRTHRGQVKAQEPEAKVGRVVRLFAEERYGFVDAEGYDVYFHANSVLHGAFDRLAVGARVRFVEEAGERGPQASSLRVLD